ncbi:MAG: 4Fe-4S dicluster domain-containing protein [Acidobacteria bacterium]|nr:4Fe-4S dicluster domain-containing protein [Acidobacteriota bacterium]
MTDSLRRRDFLKLVGLAGVAGTVGCGEQPARSLIPQMVPYEDIHPGVAAWYATTCRECPAGCGMTVRTREGRATKVEGNPQHPISRGGLCVRGQASLQGLYNPDRIQQPFLRDTSGAIQNISWEEAEEQLRERIGALQEAGEGDKIVFLTGRNGESFNQLADRWLGALGSDRHIVYEAFSQAPILEANEITFGTRAVPSYGIAEADYIVSFGADFLETWLSPVGFSRDFAQMHAYRDGRMGKLVQVEPRLSLTGANADEWVSIKPGTEMFLALGMAHRIVTGKLGVTLSSGEAQGLENLLAPYAPDSVAALTEVPGETIERMAREFAGASAGLALGGGVAATGENATATQVAINLLNYVTGRIGQTIRFDRPRYTEESAGLGSLAELVESMNQGNVKFLLVHQANPVYNLPPALGFADALQKVPFVVSFSSFADETTGLAHMAMPDLTPLEQWGDFRPAAGVHSLMQPTMNPVFDGRATGDVLLQVAKQLGGAVAEAFPWENFQEYLKERWKETYGESAGENFEQFWRDALQRGGVWDSSSSSAEAAAGAGSNLRLTSQALRFSFLPAGFAGQGEFFLHLYPSIHYYDGRGANRPWLQEIPDPITNIVWDSWVEVHPETAGRMGIVEGDLLRVESPAGSVEVPAYIYAGVRPDTVAIPLGQGHESYGRYATGLGVNPAVLLPAASDSHTETPAWSCTKVQISKTGRRSELVRTDGSVKELGRGISEIIPLSALIAGPQGEQHEEPAEQHAAQSMYPPHEHTDYRWGMAIDLSACTGCGACVAACYAENNIPVVGKQQIARGRHMAWIRIERYIENIAVNSSVAPDMRFSPMLCQQCDNAPCEPVCPVYATMHSSEGLNLQVYNRCVGTRYCSNNCPYKVRVFNWFEYEFPEPLHLQLNPDVVVRDKGVMEKCTFCVQRIREGKDHAKDEGRLVRDGEVTPACAQSCPTQAIVFGNLLDPESVVSRLSRRQHGYHALEELNTKPAITYLPRVKRI